MMLRGTLVSAAVVAGLIASAGAAAAQPVPTVPDHSKDKSEQVAEGAAEMLGGAFHAIPGWSRDSLRELRKTLFQ